MKKKINIDEDLSTLQFSDTITSSLKLFNITKIKDLLEKTKNDLKCIKGFGSQKIKIIEGVLLNSGLRLKKETKQKDLNYPFKRLLIRKMLKDDADINWPNELRIVNILLSEFPNLNFWGVFSLPYKLNSMAFLRSERGKGIIKSKYFNSLQDETEVVQKTPILSESKIDKDIIQHKPLSIKDFLNG